MLAVAVIAAKRDLLSRFVDRAGRTTLDAGPAAPIEGVQAVAIGLGVGADGRGEAQGGDDAADPAIGAALGDERLLQAKVPTPAAKATWRSDQKGSQPSES